MISNRRCTWLLAVLLAVPFVGGSIASAQNQGEEGAPRGQMGPGGRRGPMSPDDRLKQMTKDFNLTADQQAKIKPILEDSRKKMQDLRNDTSGDRQSMRTKMQEIQRDANNQIRALLDDKQKDKFDKQEKEREQRMQGRGRGMGGRAASRNHSNLEAHHAAAFLANRRTEARPGASVPRQGNCPPQREQSPTLPDIVV